MSPNRHSISAVSTAKKLNTPLKASVVLLTAVILASCATSGGDNSTTPKPTPVLPGVEDGGTGGETGGGETSGGETSGGETSGDIAAIKDAEARAKDAEAKAAIAEDQTKVAQAKLAEATKALDVAKKTAQEKIEAIEKASKSELNAAKKAAKTAQDALKIAEDTFNVESSKAVAAAKAEAAEAKGAAQAARAEAVAKIEAAAKASNADVDAAKKVAAEAVEKVKAAEEKAKAADTRATAAETKAQEIQESLKAETAAKEAAQAKNKVAETETKKAQDKAKTAEEKAVAADKAVADAKADATKKIAAIEKASASQIAAAEQEAKVAQEALKTAEAKAIVATKAAAKAAAQAAAAAQAEAAAKIKAAEALADQGTVAAAAAKKEAAAAKARAESAETAAATAKKKADDAIGAAQTATAQKEAALQAKADADARATDAEAATAIAVEAKEKAEATAAEAEDARAEAEKAKVEAEEALEAALANGGSGDAEAAQAAADAKAAIAEEKATAAQAAAQAAQAAQAAAEAEAMTAQAAQQAAEDALAAAAIKNAPESKKTGVQSLNIDSPLGVYNTTTRDFDINGDSVVARADIASDDLLPKVPVTISGSNDTELANGFMNHDDSTTIPTDLGVLPLTYTSTYKDFGDDMRIGHIDGAATVAALGGTKLPVNGVAVVGNATQAANMPTEGKVGYTGDATYRKLGIGNDIEFGKSVFTADFVAQNVKGDLTFADAGKIGLTAGINGNQFSGAAADNDGYATEGGFFGGDAQYLGGVYAGNDAQGTYGATSDKQTAAQAAVKAAQAQAQALAQALATAQADAQAAQAAAAKAQADAEKAQAAAEKAQQNADNAANGNGGSALQDALDRAADAEAAQAAAEDATRVAVAAAQAEATAAAQAAAAAQAEAAAKIKAAEALADQGTVAAAAAKKEAAAAKARTEAAETVAATAKKKADDAETARDEAIARAEAAEAEALEAANAFSAPDSRISGVQSTSVDSDDAIFDNNSNSYDQLKVYTNEINARTSLKPIDVSLRGANDGAGDNAYGTGNNGFKEHKDSTSFEGRLGGTIHKRDMNYSSVYKNFDDQMQIGHVFGDIKNGLLYNSNLSNTYVQGNATNLGDMDKLTNVNEGKANYKGVATYVEGGEISVDGTSKFDVDFVAKSVKGELDFADKQVDIAATISDNTFASEEGAAVNTVGGFYGKGASLLGGVYERETKGTNYIKGTYGATKTDSTVEVVPDPTESKMTGFQSTALSSKEKTLPFGQGQLDNAIGYVEIRDDKSAWTDTKTENGGKVPVDNRKGDNFTNFNTGKVLADMVKPDDVLKPIGVSLTGASGSVEVDAGRGGLNPTYEYNAVYKNFDSQMQIGHVYGNLNSIAGDVSRAANVYVEGYLTSQAGMDNLKNVNDGKAQYNGVATYIENIHLADTVSTAPVNGTSAFNVDFAGGKVDGTLSFTGTDYKYMPEGNQIGIAADITGNTFAGNKNGIDTAGGFYGEDAQFLGGIYQDSSDQGGKGTVAGTGTKFQGTFGAEKQ